MAAFFERVLNAFYGSVFKTSFGYFIAFSYILHSAADLKKNPKKLVCVFFIVLWVA
jgi:hypothetical protein